MSESVQRYTLFDTERLHDQAWKSSGIFQSRTRHCTGIIETIDDGHPIQNCPELIMKIFDDRFMNVPSPYNEDEVLEDNDVGAYLWFRTIRLLTAWQVRIDSV